MKLLAAVALVNGHSEANSDDLTFIQRVADDCLPPDRLKVIETLRKAPEGQFRSIREISKGPVTWMPDTTTGRVLEDLDMLEVVERDLESEISRENPRRYRLKALPVM